MVQLLADETNFFARLGELELEASVLVVGSDELLAQLFFVEVEEAVLVHLIHRINPLP
jgi:hypothetical protein